MWHAAAYFDESDDNDRAYAVAGFLAHQHDCVHLDLAWRDRILEKYELEYFKASELNAGTRQFAKFRDNPSNLDCLFSRREKELFGKIKTESIDIFLEFGHVAGIGVVLVLPDYYRLLEEYKPLGKALPAPYLFCANIMMMEIGVMMNEVNDALRRNKVSQRGVVRPVFDSHKTYSGRSKLMFDEFVRKNEFCSKYLLPPHYENDKDYVVLQIADNLAYECRRLLVTSDFDTHIPERMAMKRLKEGIYRIYKLNYDGLKAIVENQPENAFLRTSIGLLKPEIQNENPFRR